MKLPAWATTVTPFTKRLALFLYIFLPFAGFYLGMHYQGRLDESKTVAYAPQVSHVSPMPQNTKRYDVRTVPLTECSVEVGSSKITLNPTKDWLCSITDLKSPGLYLLTLTSKPFTVAIDNLGRDPYCQGDTKCLVTTFYTTDALNLNLYTYDGKDKEIYGDFPPAKKPGQFSGNIAVKYDSMENAKLTPDQKNKLLTLLKSIVIEPRSTITPFPNSPTPQPTIEAGGAEGNAIMCTQEVQMCPNGSSVGRVGPKCEFAPCPSNTP